LPRTSKKKLTRELIKVTKKYIERDVQYKRLVKEVNELISKPDDVIFYPQSKKYVIRILDNIRRIIS